MLYNQPKKTQDPVEESDNSESTENDDLVNNSEKIYTVRWNTKKPTSWKPFAFVGSFIVFVIILKFLLG